MTLAAIPLSEALAACARLVAAVARGRSLGAGAVLPDDASAALRAQAFELARTTLRQWGTAAALRRRMVRRQPAPLAAALIDAALAQLLDAQRGAHTVVDQAVAACRPLGLAAGVRGLVNATLRGFLRERAELLALVRTDPQARWNHPGWWIELLRREQPDDWQRILELANRAPALVLRVNRRRSSPDGYLARLAALDIVARRVGSEAIRLETSIELARLPGFADGQVSVQDAGAQLAAHLLDARDGMRVLDACAAPGGKTAHLLERADLDRLAIDADPARLERVRDNLGRAGLQARLLAADARAPSQWWDGRAFDRILLDAPCTASGIGRRHPDIRWLRRPGDLQALSQLQRELLAALWPLLAPGGKLLYATCSLFRAENEAVAAWFADAHPDSVHESPCARVGLDREQPVSRLLPCSTPEREHDGFYYALFRKIT
ncbi:MAG: 16S rRNA (cytosine(967)-C(5))-methyltransferase RsmB [Burkholderiales bacterium]|nr:MAG: 16S rRNA (cytosine(967)-C(5))-methyltransferase RsmB [Burkholderiales bacterium]